jgi:rRNA-processing protein FCF1
MNAARVSPRPLLLIVDANVLIDYAISDASILALAVKHLGPIHVPLPILEEVDQLTDADCARLGITLLDPTLDELAAAAALPRATLSFEDKLCLVLAKANGFICVTNDKHLRGECEAAGVTPRWGLQVMSDLVVIRELTPEAAIATARRMSTANPHITKALLARFEKHIHSLPHRHRGI